MKTAAKSKPDAPAKATCPECGDVITLRNDHVFTDHLMDKHSFTIHQAVRAAKKAGAQ